MEGTQVKWTTADTAFIAEIGDYTIEVSSNLQSWTFYVWQGTVQVATGKGIESSAVAKQKALEAVQAHREGK